jgi:hypothetical protein
VCVCVQNAVSERLYSKFHHEACMHYARQFIPLGLWMTERANHVKTHCERVSPNFSYFCFPV